MYTDAMKESSQLNKNKSIYRKFTLVHVHKKVIFTMMNQLFYTVRIVHGHSKQLKCKYFVNFKSSFHRLSLS